MSALQNRANLYMTVDFKIVYSECQNQVFVLSNSAFSYFDIRKAILTRIGRAPVPIR